MAVRHRKFRVASTAKKRQQLRRAPNMICRFIPFHVPSDKLASFYLSSIVKKCAFGEKKSHNLLH